MKNLLLDFVKDERGQDVLEHTFALAFVVLLGVVLLHGAGTGIRTIWASGNAVLAGANTAEG